MSISGLKGYQKKVRRIKNSLLIMAAALMALVVFYPLYYYGKEEMSFAQRDNANEAFKDEMHEAKTPKIESPKFYGIDQKDKPYTIVAKIGEQLDKGNVKLTDVSSQLKLDDGSTLIMNSKTADIEIDKNILNLKGDINIDVGGKYFIEADNAQLNYNTRDAQSDSKVKLKSENSEVQADSFKTFNSYDEILFTNNVKTILYISNEKK